MVCEFAGCKNRSFTCTKLWRADMVHAVSTASLAVLAELHKSQLQPAQIVGTTPNFSCRWGVLPAINSTAVLEWVQDFKSARIAFGSC